ncbi:RteC domain-containing protein [Negadavirga shengliensis]|uniref:RteC domain-containing protein n=1 Tax=Negadavirga shengliensis TaxID=1389218 RepID=A0ABV9T080_9BACT
MNSFCDKYYERMSEDLLHISLSTDNPIELAEKSFKAIKKAYYELKANISGYTFKDDQEEIEFFKITQPKFLCEMIYFAEVFRIESNCPVRPFKMKKNHYKLEMEGISKFYERNQELYWYFISGKTDLDDKLFLNSNKVDLSFPDIFFFNADPDFCCPCSYKVAQFLGFKKLLEYIQSTIENIGKKSMIKTGPVWTGPKVWLIELIYALKAAGVFNKGKVDIKDIANATGPIFQKDLGEYYRTFQEIRLRKKNRTIFIDHLKESLMEYMDAADGI